MQIFNQSSFENVIELTRHAFKMLKACMSDDETRYSLNFIYVEKEKNRICSSDGRRAIIFNIPEEIKIETGFYLPVEKTNRVKYGRRYFLMRCVINGLKYSDIDKIIPNYAKKKNVFREDVYYINTEFKKSQFIFDLMDRTRAVINLTYLKILQYADDFNVKFENPNKTILFYNETFKYIVMPMINYKLD